MKQLNPDILADDLALDSTRREMEDDIISDAFFDFTKGKRTWRAVCLTDSDTRDKNVINSLDGRRLPIKLRVLDTLDNIIPNPCDLVYNAEQVKRLTSLFPTGYSDQPLDNQYALPSFGQVVRVSFDSKGPPEQGRHRGLLYTFRSTYDDQRYDCETRSFQGGKTTFGQGGRLMGNYHPTPPPQECGESIAAKNRKRFYLTFTDLGVLVPHFTELLQWIHSGESKSSGYEAANRGTKPGGGIRHGKGKYKPETHFGKKFVEMTVKEVRCTQKPYTEGKGKKKKTFDERGNCPDIAKYDSKNHYLAVGKYQLIPGTLASAVNRLSKHSDFDPETQLFDASTQERFGLYTILVKRPMIANYLVDNHDNTCNAAQYLALEYASVGLQYATGSDGRGDAFKQKHGNKAKHTPEEAYAMLKRTKENLQSNTSAMEVLKKYKVK